MWGVWFFVEGGWLFWCGILYISISTCGSWVLLWAGVCVSVKGIFFSISSAVYGDVGVDVFTINWCLVSIYSFLLESFPFCIWLGGFLGILRDFGYVWVHVLSPQGRGGVGSWWAILVWVEFWIVIDAVYIFVFMSLGVACLFLR